MLQYRTVSSPAAVEGAVQAYFGIREWEPRYDELRADYAIRSSKVLYDTAASRRDQKPQVGRAPKNALRGRVK